MKTNSGAKKGLPLLDQERLKKHAFKSHILTKKTTKQNVTLLILHLYARQT